MSLEQQNRDVTAEILHCSIGADLVAKLRSLEREDLRELAGRSLPPLVELQVAWLLRDIAKLEEILTTSSSHAVRIRASTALLKLDPTKLLRLISPEAGEEPSPLSSSCRHAALASLARLGHSALPTSLTLLNLKGLGARRTAARILLKAANEPELVREQWPLLLRSLPFKAAFSMACRMPGLCLELLLQLPPPWPPQQLARVASVAVSASPEDALRLMQREQRSQGRWLVEPLTLAIVKGLSRKLAPEDMLRALGQWLPAPRRKPPDGLPEQWGALLARLAERASRRGEHLWPQVLGTTIQLMNCFDSGSAATLLVATLVKLPFGQLEVVTDQQLAEFFNSVELQHLGDVFQSLRAKGIAEQRLDAVPIRTVEATEALVKHFGQLQRLSSWPRLARQRLSQQLTSSKPMEVAGGQAPEEYLEILAWQPAATAMDEIKRRCNNSNALARQVCFSALIRCAAREGPQAIEDALSFFERRLKNEQDNVRTAVLQHMSTVVPLLSWRASHVKSFKQLLTFSLQAKGSSSASLHAWRGLMEVLLASGVAYLEAEVSACGQFALETMQQLRLARVWPQDDTHFGARVLQHLVDSESSSEAASEAFRLTTEMIDWLVLCFLRPGVQDLLNASRVVEACGQLLHWNNILLERARSFRRSRRGTALIASPALTALAQESFGAASQALSSWWSLPRTVRQVITFLLQYPLESDARELLAAQEEAISRLCELCSKPSFLRVFDWSLEPIPWHWASALQLLQGDLQTRPELHNQLLNALCMGWEGSNDTQRFSFATTIISNVTAIRNQRNRVEALAPLLQQIWSWRFSFQISRSSETEQVQAAWALRMKISLRKQAEQLLLSKKRKKRAAARALLQHWANQTDEFRLELLCSSDLLLRTLQYRPHQLLLPGHGCDGKLGHLQRLAVEFQVPLHLLKETKASHVAAPFFHWPPDLQAAFANFWCLPTLTEHGMHRSLKPACNERVIVRCAQLFLALPDVDHAPLQRLMDVCARQLDTGDAGTERTEQALLRGSCGRILDQLLLLLAASDRPSAVLPIFESHLGRGVSKQAARSFQRLLRRTAPVEAQQTLAKLLAAESGCLKVAEQVALVRLVGEFLGKAAVEPLKAIWQKCHRDVAGAVLCQFCHPKVSCDASAAVVEDLCIQVKAGSREPYQLQILLQHLQGNPCDDRVAKNLVTTAGGADPTLAELALGALEACWSKQQLSSTSTSAAVAAVASEVLCRFDAGWQVAAPAAMRCLMHLAAAEAELLKKGLCTLATLTSMKAMRRLRHMAELLVEEADPTVRSAAAAALLGNVGCGAAVRWGLELWARDLHWNEATGLLQQVAQLPTDIREEPLFLAPMLRSCKASLARETLETLQLKDTALHLASTLPELPKGHVEAIMVLLLAMDAEALEPCLEERTPSLALQVLLADLQDAGMSTGPTVAEDEDFEDEDEDYDYE